MTPFPPVHILRLMLTGYPDTWAAVVLRCSSAYIRSRRQDLGIAPVRMGRRSNAERSRYLEKWTALLKNAGYALKSIDRRRRKRA